MFGFLRMPGRTKLSILLVLYSSVFIGKIAYSIPPRSVDSADAAPFHGVRELMTLFDLSRDLKTDPIFLQKLMSTLMIDDFQPIVHHLAISLEEPESLQPMIEQIEQAVIQKHPTINQAIQEVMDRGLITEELRHLGHVEFKALIHQIFLLEELVKVLARNVAYLKEFKAHMERKRVELKFGTYWTFLIQTGMLFGTVKLYSIDRAYQGLIHALEGEDSNRKPQRTWIPEMSWPVGLSINILEAVVTDACHGFFENAEAGLSLMGHPMKSCHLSEDRKSIEFVLPSGCEAWYHSWNLAFVLGNLSYPRILLPKLLIPSVISARNDQYLYHRIIALWASMNWYLFAELNGEVKKEIPIAKELAKILGKINKDYAQSGSFCDSSESSLGFRLEDF